MSYRLCISGFLALLIAAALPRSVRADRCDVISTLESLPLAHRDLLHRLCQLDAGSARKLAEKLASHDQTARDVTLERLQKVIRRLVSRHVWAASVLREVLPPDFVTEPDGALKQLVARIHSIDGYHAALSTFIAHSVEPDKTLRDYVLDDAIAKAAFESYLDKSLKLGSDIGAVRFQVLVGRSQDEVRVAYSGTTPNVIAPIPIYEVGDRRAYLLVTPPNVHASISVERVGLRFDLRIPVIDDGALLLEPLGLGCLDLDVRAERGAEIFVDGRRVPAVLDPKQADVQTLQVAVAQHDIAVLEGRREGDAGRAVLSTGTIEASALEKIGCAQYERDLTQSELGSVIALLDVGVEPSCVAAGLDAVKLRRAAVEFLGRSGREVRELDTWGSSMEDVEHLTRLVKELGGETVGAARDRLDSTRALATGAGEYLRRGFSDILTIDAHCSQRVASSGYDYSFIVRDIDIGKLNRAPRDPVLGFSIRDVVRTAVQVTDVQHRLRSALLMAIAEPLGISYARLDGVTESVPEHATARFDVEALAPPSGDASYRLLLRSRILGSKSAEHECNELQRHGALRSQRDPTERAWALVTEQDIKAQSISIGTTMTMRAQSTAPIAVRLTLQRVSGDGGITTISEDYGCVRVTRPNTLVWSEFGLWTLPGDGRGGEDYQAQSFMAGFDIQDVPVGLLIGYIASQRSGDELPSWRGIEDGTIDYRLDGSARYQVSERRIIFGLSFEYGFSLCDLTTFFCRDVVDRFGLEQRVLVFGGVTFVDLKGAASAAESDRARGDAGALAQSGLRFQITPEMRLLMSFNYGVPQVVDALTTSADRIGQPSFFDQFVIGLSAGLSWGWPW